MDKIELDEKAVDAAVATTPFGPVARVAIGNAIRAYLASSTSEPVAVKATDPNGTANGCCWHCGGTGQPGGVMGGPEHGVCSFCLGTGRDAALTPPAAPAAPADGVPISVMIGAEVRRRNRVGADDEKGAISPSCEMAATEIVLSALNDCGFCVSWKPAPALADASLKATRETA